MMVMVVMAVMVLVIKSLSNRPAMVADQKSKEMGLLLNSSPASYIQTKCPLVIPHQSKWTPEITNNPYYYYY